MSVTLDPRRKKRFDDLMRQMAGAQRDEASGFDAYWEAVGEIIARSLYVAGGHETADAFLKSVVKQPKRSAMRLIRVARHASPAEEVKYGTAVLDAALAYIEALTGGPIEGRLPIAFEKLRVPVTRNGKPVKVPLEEATLREISTATRALTAKSAKARPRRPPAEAALASALHKERDLSGITVSLADGHVRFGPVPFAALAAFGRALAAAKLPSSS